MQKAIEVIRNLNYFEFSDARNNFLSSPAYSKSFIFLLNQYYAQEFIHNSSELDERILHETIRLSNSAVVAAATSTASRNFSLENNSYDGDKLTEDVFAGLHQHHYINHN